MSDQLSENEMFAAVVKIVDPRAYEIWQHGSFDPGSEGDMQWKAAKVKAEAILRLIQPSTPESASVSETGHRNCPFCGAEPRLVDPTYNGPADCWDTYIECSQCEARSAGVLREHGDDEEWEINRAWTGWDQRAAEPNRGIKPLEWDTDSEAGELTYFVTTIIGRYAAWMKKSEAYVLLPDAVRSQVVGDKISDALNFAREHFSKQIRGQFF